MTWARFDDTYGDHPKIVAAGPWGELLDFRATLWCCRHETDGHVPTAMLGRLAHDIPKAPQVAARLVEVGKWEQTDDGWQIHDFPPPTAHSPDPPRPLTQAERPHADCELCHGDGYVVPADGTIDGVVPCPNLAEATT